MVDTNDRVLKTKRVEGVERRNQQVNLGKGGCIADDVDVTLHELAVAALLWSLGAPDRPGLNRLQNGWQLGTVGCVVAG